jgi:hypothetical protein
MKIDSADQIKEILLGSIEKSIGQGNFQIKDYRYAIIPRIKSKTFGHC